MNVLRNTVRVLTGLFLGTVVVLFLTTGDGPEPPNATRTDQIDQNGHQRPPHAEIPRAERTALRADYFHRLYRDPKTDRVPADMHLRNRAFIERLKATAAHKSQQQQIYWQEAGPNNVGGRTRALALDRRDSDVILTGGVRGGLWKSIDGGTTWRHATGLTQNESITSIAQHPLVPDTWYAATGEFVGTGGANGAGVANFGGGGLYTTRDNGASWDLYRYARAFEADQRRTRYERIFDDRLVSASSELDDNPFLYSSRIAVSPTTGTVFVATHGWGLLRSTDDLATFDHALPGLPQQVTRKELEADEETLLLLHFNDTPDGVDGEAPTNTPTLDYEEGVFGQGAYLGAGDHLTFTSDGNINGQQGTLEFWIKPRWDGNDGGENDFLIFGPIPTAVFVHRVFGGVEIIVQWGTQGAPPIGAFAGVEDWVADAWRHVAFTWDDSAVRTYIDGQLRTESAHTSPLPEITAATFDIGNSARPEVPIDAVLDELRISGVARTPEEILESYQSGAEDDTVPIPAHRPRFSDIAVDQAGNLLAYVSGSVAEGAGVYYSTDDGVTWTDHTPAGFPQDLSRGVVAIAPSNPDVAYVLLHSGEERFYKFELSQKTAEDRSENVPFFLFSPPDGFGLNANDYNMMVSVKPDDEAFVVIGGVLLARSLDGLATPPDDLLDNYIQAGTHVDNHLAVFDPRDPNALWLTNDGGVYKTEDITRTSSQIYATVQWIDKNVGYNVTQFFTVALPPRIGDNRIMGGTQDNGTPVMDRGASRDPVPSLGDAFGGDGAFAFFGEQYGYVSAQLGEVYRLGYDANGKPSFEVSAIDLTPGRGRGQLFIHPFVVDPNDEDVIYYPLQNKVLRHTMNTSLTDHLKPEDWESLDQVAAPEGSLLTAINVSTTPADVLYYAAGGGTGPPSIYRLEDAKEATTGVQKIAIPEAEAGTWVQCIAINPDDADEILVVVSNYNVVSLFHSTDGGQTYQTVEGNLAGDAMLPGPTMDWADVLTFNGQTYYFVATSIGVFMTQQLDGDDTVWTLQSEDVIGYALAKMIRSRASDGLIAVATHGRGIFVGYPADSPATSNEADAALPVAMVLEAPYPNPFNEAATITFTLSRPSDVSLAVYDVLGRQVARVAQGHYEAGRHRLRWPARYLASGTYFLRLEAGGVRQTRPLTLAR